MASYNYLRPERGATGGAPPHSPRRRRVGSEERSQRCSGPWHLDDAFNGCIYAIWEPRAGAGEAGAWEKRDGAGSGGGVRPKIGRKEWKQGSQRGDDQAREIIEYQACGGGKGGRWRSGAVLGRAAVGGMTQKTCQRRSVWSGHQQRVSWGMMKI
jgi:hypothetical protein